MGKSKKKVTTQQVEVWKKVASLSLTYKGKKKASASSSQLASKKEKDLPLIIDLHNQSWPISKECNFIITSFNEDKIASNNIKLIIYMGWTVRLKYEEMWYATLVWDFYSNILIEKMQEDMS